VKPLALIDIAIGKLKRACIFSKSDIPKSTDQLDYR